jgi:hypothetical protein
MKNHRNASLRKLANTFSIAMLITSASASELPTEKLNALQCASNANESCCERWVNVVMTAALAETNPVSMLIVLPRRIDRWVKIEKRSYCAIRRDIEVRASVSGTQAK